MRPSGGPWVLRHFKVLLTILAAAFALGHWLTPVAHQPVVVEHSEASVEAPHTTEAPVVPAAAPITGHAIRPELRPASRTLGGNAASGEAFAQLPRGVESVGAKQRHKVMGARAIPLKGYQGPEDQVVAKLSGFAILSDASAAQEWGEVRIKEHERPVLWNTDSRRSEIVSGTFIVQLKDAGLGPAVAARHGLKVLSADDSIKTVYLKMPAGYRVFAGEKALRADADVTGVEIELLSGGMRPR